MNGKRILFVIPSFNVGGTAYSTFNMLTILEKEGYVFSVFAMSHQGPVKDLFRRFSILREKLWISIISSATNKEKGLKRVLSIILKVVAKILQIINIDVSQVIYKYTARQIEKSDMFDIVVACQEGASTQFVSSFNANKKIAWVRCEYSSYRNMIIEKQYFKEKDFIYPSFNLIVCVSETTKNDFISHFGQLREKVLAIHNIQDIESIKQRAEDDSEVLFSKDYFNIISIGRIAPQKRFYLIPQIASYLKNHEIVFKWYIIGSGNIDGEGDRLNNAIRHYKCEDCVILLGHKINPYPFIKTADLLVSTSYTEACPRVLAEAQILNTPVVCTNFNSAKEFVTNGVNGIIGSLDDLPTIIEEIIINADKYNLLKEGVSFQSLYQENCSIMDQLSSVFS